MHCANLQRQIPPLPLCPPPLFSRFHSRKTPARAQSKFPKTRRSITANYFLGQQLIFESPLPSPPPTPTNEGDAAFTLGRPRINPAISPASQSPQFATTTSTTSGKRGFKAYQYIPLATFFPPPLSDSSPSGLYGIFPSIPELALILTGADSSPVHTGWHCSFPTRFPEREGTGEGRGRRR